MTVAQFEAVKLLLNLSDDRVNAARAVLVDGQTLRSVGARYGWTRQAVDDAVGIAWKTFGRYQSAQRAEAGASVVLPRGWEQVTFTAPRAVIEQLREHAASALADIGPGPAARPRIPRRQGGSRKHPVQEATTDQADHHEPVEGGPGPSPEGTGDVS